VDDYGHPDSLPLPAFTVEAADCALLLTWIVARPTSLCHQLLGWEPLRGDGCQKGQAKNHTAGTRKRTSNRVRTLQKLPPYSNYQRKARLTVLIAAHKSRAGLFDNIIKLYYPWDRLAQEWTPNDRQLSPAWRSAQPMWRSPSSAFLIWG
jgi:hypothetical protein